LRRAAWCASVVLAAVAGGVPLTFGRTALPPPVCPLEAYRPRKSFAPGAVVEIEFAAPVDALPVGTRWTGAELARSPLEPMFRPAVIVKADDLRSLDVAFRRFIDLMARRDLPISIGVIGRSLEGAPPEAIECLSRADPAVVELWNHGYDHQLGEGHSEFSGTGTAAQDAHLRATQRAAQQRLGVLFHAFGAPGNAWDGDTVQALLGFPEIEAVFYGPEVPGRRTLKRTVDIERPIFVVAAREAFLAELGGADRAPLVLQVHPRAWGLLSWWRFQQIVEHLDREDHRRFTTPTQEARWLEARDRIALSKVGPVRYQLDLRAVGRPLTLEMTGRIAALSESRAAR
jgi:hypothetical protein